MVWAGITAYHKTSLVFFKKDQTVNKKVYLNLLKKKLKPWGQKKFGREQFSTRFSTSPQI